MSANFRTALSEQRLNLPGIANIEYATQTNPTCDHSQATKPNLLASQRKRTQPLETLRANPLPPDLTNPGRPIFWETANVAAAPEPVKECSLKIF
jgi:hypothetical protein